MSTPTTESPDRPSSISTERDSIANSGGQLSPLARWLKKVPPAGGDALLWCHTTDSYSFDEILSSNSLVPQPCPVFKEDLSYLFYGRPAYRVTDDAPISIDANAPVVLLLGSNLIEQAERVFPFDSGAFAAGRYSKWLNKRMKLSQFNVETNGGTPRKLVTAFFRDTERYFSCLASNPDIPYGGEHIVDSLVRILSDPDTKAADDRRLAFEMQVKSPIPLNSTYIQAIILPRVWQGTDAIKAFTLINPTVKLDFYTLHHQKAPREYQMLFEDRSERLHRDLGLL